jgi:hypothetical protein
LSAHASEGQPLGVDGSAALGSEEVDLVISSRNARPVAPIGFDRQVQPVQRAAQLIGRLTRYFAVLVLFETGDVK